MRYTLRQLSYFVAAGEAGSILKASENIHVSQPSISNAISQLEDTFGVQLFIRHHAQGMSLTTAGRELFREAKQLLGDAERLQGIAGELSDQIIGTIELGSFTPIASIVTPELCHSFMSGHPKTDVRVREAHQADLLQLLRQGSIDLALTYDLELQSDIEFIPLAKLSPYVLLSAKDPLVKKGPIDIKDLVDEPMVLLDLPHSSEYFMSIFSKNNIKPTIKARTHLTDVQRGLVASGHGYSLANVRPKNQRALDGKPLKYVSLIGDHATLTLGLASLNNTKMSQAQKAFIEFCQLQITNNAIPGMIQGFD
jgi:DNA-binding transcriptional LysR family regulator